MGDERIISENHGVNVVEYNIAKISVRYSISSSLEIGTTQEILDGMIPYV